MRKTAHFRSHHREAATLLAGARRFHGRIQRKDIGLKRDTVDNRNDVRDFARTFLNLIHGGNDFAHHLPAVRRHGIGAFRQHVRFARALGILAYRGGQLLHARRGLLQRRRLLLGALRQVGVSRGHLIRRSVNGFRAGTNIAHHARQIFIHGLQCQHEFPKLASAIRFNYCRQISGRHPIGKQHGLFKWRGNRTLRQNQHPHQ